MKTEYAKPFLKALKSLRGTPHFQKIHTIVFDEIRLVDSVDEIPNCLKLKSHDIHYRIRVGNYRIGFRLENEVILFEWVGHRNHFYEQFP